MKRKLLMWAFGPCCVAGLLAAAGCQMFDTRPAPPLQVTAEKSPKLNVAQVADVKIAVARSLEDRGEYEQAEGAYREALQKAPNRVDALLRLAALRDRNGK